MALQVWLPLTKDLRQQGLSNATVTSNTATYSSTGGKLGGYYTKSLTVSSSNIATILSGYEFSVCFWIYINELPTETTLADTYVMYAGTAATRQQFHIVIRAESQGSAFAFCFYGDDYSFYDTVSDKLNRWMHVACLFKNNTQIVYVNGEKIGEREVTDKMSIPANSSLVVQNPHNRLNDLRIYDNCLTPEEVKKIAQGLVLHYPLNHQGWERENLVWDTRWDEFSTKWDAWGSPSIREIVSTYGKKYLHVKSSDRWQGYSQNQTKRNGIGEIVAGEKLTLSCWAYSNTTLTNYPCVGIHWTDGTSIIAQSWPQFTITTTPQKFTTVLTVPNGVSAFNIMVGNGDGTVDGVYEIWVANVKLEKGEIATSWCPNSSDELAIRAGISEVIEYDISGFENNGIRVADSNNLFKGTTFSSFDRSNFVNNSSGDWTSYLRYYNGSAANHSFSDGIDTITLNAASNLGVAFVRKATDINLDSNSYYTISCEAMSTQTTQPLCIGLSYYNASNAWVWRGGTNGTNFTAANTWQKFSLTFTPDADTQYICYCFTVVGTSGGTDTFKIRNCKLEKGSVATDWSPGTIQKYTSDTPKYQVSTEFNANNYIQLPTFSLDMSEGTFCTWFLYKSFDSYARIFDFADLASGAGNCIVVSLREATPTLMVNGRIQGEFLPSTDVATLTLNTWYYIVVVIKNNMCNTYINGQLVKTFELTNSFSTVSFNLSYLGKSTWPSDLLLNGQESDFRIYATALSAEDILELYQNSNLSNS